MDEEFPDEASGFEPLSPSEIRILGALMEKERTTPEYYPMTINALRNACNQKSSRDPVMELTEGGVETGVEMLRDRLLAAISHTAGSKTEKFRHMAARFFNLNDAEQAVLCVLLLRGPQTVGQIRTRTARMFEFKELNEVQEVLTQLAKRENQPLVVELPRASGQKDRRYVHLLGGTPDVREETEPVVEQKAPLKPVEEASELRVEIASLREEFKQLRDEFDQFKTQFE